MKDYDDINIELNSSAGSLKVIADQTRERVQVEEQAYPDASLNNGKIHSDFIEQCMQASELGLGVFYVEVNKGQLIYNVTSAKWMIFNGVHWVDDDHNQYLYACEHVVRRLLEEATALGDKIGWAIQKKDIPTQKRLEAKKDLIMKRISALRTDKGRNSTVKFAISCRDPITITADDFDLDPWLLGCANGVIDLRSGKFVPGEPEQYINKASPTKWEGIDTPAPEWEKFVLSIMADDVEMYYYLQRLLGYSISGLTREHIMPVFWGKGRNGKGTLVKIMMYVMGDLSGPVKTELLLHQKMSKSPGAADPEITDLKGLRQAFCSETEPGQKFSTSRVKWLTGADRLVGRNLNEKKLNRFDPTHTIFLMTNDQPSVDGDDYAFWQRVHLIPFILSFVTRKPEEMKEFERPEDKDLEDKLKAEASGVLAWLVRGFLHYQKQGGLNPPDKVKKATLEYQRAEDVLGVFIEDHCRIAPGVWTKSSEIYNEFLKWYKATISDKGIKQKSFGKMMKKKFSSEKKSGIYYYIGIELDNSRPFVLTGD